MDNDELIESWDELVIVVDRDVRPTLPSSETIDDSSVRWRGPWRPDFHYMKNDAVKFGNQDFVAIENSINCTPGPINGVWSRYCAVLDFNTSELNVETYTNSSKFAAQMDFIAERLATMRVLHPRDIVNITGI